MQWSLEKVPGDANMGVERVGFKSDGRCGGCSGNCKVWRQRPKTVKTRVLEGFELLVGVPDLP